ncbi:MAG: FixH family protein [Cytophagales bacterium]|nr:FixH family protein [Cytophagales bacterium]
MKWIIGAFVFFALFMGVLVFLAMRQEVSLVSKTYYDDELKHSDKMLRISNANALPAKPELSFEGNRVKLSYMQLSQVENGRLTVQRPSKAALDYQFEVKPTAASSQQFELKAWEPGLYRVDFSWSVNGQEYYVEKLLVL